MYTVHLCVIIASLLLLWFYLIYWSIHLL